MDDEQKKPEGIRVDVDNGKYTVVQAPGGGTQILRHGEPWMGEDGGGFAGVNCVLAMAYELEELRARQNHVTVDLKASEMPQVSEALVLIDFAARQFRYYETQHNSKANDEGANAEYRQQARDKAFTNAEIADTLEGFLAGRDYHSLAMRTAAGPDVFHYPTTAAGDGPEDQQMEADDAAFVNDVRDFLIAAAKLDDWKSLLFYGKSKYAGNHPTLPDFPDYDDLLEGEMSLDFIQNPQLVHAVLGIASEAGEIVSDLTEVMRGDTWQAAIDDKGTDMAKPVINMVRESGDIDWFQELLAAALKFPVAKSRMENIARLRRRFPDKFTEADAVARADERTHDSTSAVDD